MSTANWLGVANQGPRARDMTGFPFGSSRCEEHVESKWGGPQAGPSKGVALPPDSRGGHSRGHKSVEPHKQVGMPLEVNFNG